MFDCRLCQFASYCFSSINGLGDYFHRVADCAWNLANRLEHCLLLVDVEFRVVLDDLLAEIGNNKHRIIRTEGDTCSFEYLDSYQFSLLLIHGDLLKLDQIKLAIDVAGNLLEPLLFHDAERLGSHDFVEGQAQLVHPLDVVAVGLMVTRRQ
ncbi:hypothetical protein FQZ97_655700 [compost metagenome]